jgi:hypothetical protein
MNASNANAKYGNWTPYSLYSKVVPLTKAICDTTMKQTKDATQIATSNQTIRRGKPMFALYQ